MLPDDPPKPGTDASTNPREHVYGADGSGLRLASAVDELPLVASGAAYVAVDDGMAALDPETGERVWRHDTGDWRWTAPSLGRDTLFVGRDALYAFDPTSGPGLVGDGPALRFEGVLPRLRRSCPRRRRALRRRPDGRVVVSLLALA